MLPMPHLKVALLGLADFERHALASALQLASSIATRTPRYTPVAVLADADLLVADADHAPSVELARATDRAGRALFVGAQPPPDAGAWLPRPLEVQRVLRQLDALALAVGDWMPAADGAPALPGEQAAPAADAHPPPRVLIVDADVAASRRLEAQLWACGLQADIAVDSGAALELLAGHGYPLVFVDVDLAEDSELGGLELCRSIQHAPELCDAAVVLLSSHASQLDRVHGALAGGDDYLAKPVADAELGRLLQRQRLMPPLPRP